jgi:tetratricopeptide (TPR) repeat protein
MRLLRAARRLLIVMVWLSFATSTQATTFDVDAESRCERIWFGVAQRAYQRSREDIASTLKRWVAYQQQCRASGYFWAKRASLEAALGNFSAAKNSLSSAPIGAAERSPALAVAEIHVHLEEYIAAGGTPDVRRLAEFDAQVTDVIRRFPDWLPAAALLGGLQVLQGRYPHAIQNLEKASTDKSIDQSIVLRNLAIAYSRFGAHSAALDAADAALKIDRNLTADPHFAAAVVVSSVRLELLDDAEIALKVVLKKNPSAGKSASLVDAAYIYNEARRTAGVRK